MDDIGHRQKVEEIAEVSQQICNRWESNFIQDMMDWEGEYTEGQQAVIDKLYDRACRSPY